jgi:DNA polymerase-3 subunit gamma/tau
MAEVPFVSLYRRFRPGRFDELRGQDHVVRALQSAVRDDRVSHAYLFSGPRGTGKTSSARILAKALNCLKPVDGEPCGVCTSCTEIARGTSLDVLELDAASNNGVDAMRELVSHAALGTPGRWKVYIVDEVHMLSTAAANALLKTLEEPPSHVVFVLATTDPQKVPATIRSRTQHLEFRLLSADTLQTLLESVRDSVGIDIDDGSLRTVVRRGRGSARDALSALEQVAASGAVASIRPELSTVVAAIAESEVSGVLVNLSALLAEGWGPQQLATELVDDLRQVFLAALAPELCSASGAERTVLAELAHAMGLPRVVRSMELLGHAMIDMRDAPDAQVVLEISLVRAARPDLDQGTAGLAERVGILERAVATGAHGSRQPESTEFPKAIPRVEEPRSTVPEEPQATLPEEPRTTPRPSVGAVRRSKSAAAAPAPAPAVTPEPEPPAALVAAVSNGGGGAAAASIDRESFTQAWGDGVLQGLSARAKALYSAGRFVAVDEDQVQFALPNEAHRARCLELVPHVEEALNQRFDTKIRLVLVVEGGESGGPVPRAPVTKPGPPSAQAEDDEYDDVAPGDFEEAEPASASAVDRLLQAFPGAEEVTD